VIGPRDLRGLWGFALTPFTADGIDAAAYMAGVRVMVEGHADVIIAAGTLGQGDRMHDDERATCLSLARQATGAAVPLLGVLTSDGPTGPAAAALLDRGADAALLLPASSDVSAVATAIDAVTAATRGQLPVVLYQRGALQLDPSDLAGLTSRPTIIGLKDAHGDLRRFRRLREAIGDRLVWVGASEDLAVAYRTHGADAVSPASLAYAPAYARRYWSALDDGDVAEAMRLLQCFAWPVTDLRWSRPDIETSVVRELARSFGHPVGLLRPPAEELMPDEVDGVERLAAILRAELAQPTGAGPLV
jgi:5-dehydro-4-deoxyglucarate dehydratase